MVLAFGFAFQVPIIIITIVWTGLVSRKTLAGARPYVFLSAFVIGMLLTPPDVFSQTLLAVPMYGLFELALFVCARLMPDR
jgi:sec-independent protein translocase protein TatC